MSILSKIAHLTVPNHSNNFRAKLLHFQGISALILFVLFFQLGLNLLSQPNIQILGYAANISPQKVVELTNQKRLDNGLNSLQYNQTLSQAAHAKGMDMLNDDYWAHVAPDGTEPWTFFKQAGYEYRYAGENLARDFQTPQSAVEAWMISTSHRENMLSPKYTQIGVAVVEGDLNGVDTTLIVQLFGDPVDTIPAVPVASAQSSPEVAETIPAEPSKDLATAATGIQGIEFDGKEILTGVVGQNSQGKTLISPLNTTRAISFAIIFVLLAVLLIDWVIIAQKGVSRRAGSPIAHISFFAMVIAILLIARSGSIL